MVQRCVAACAIAWAALCTITDAAKIDPAYAKNVTLYHVNEKNYSTAPVNMNTADINGDIYFDLRTRGLPLECGPWINQSFWSRLDCVNSEVNVDPSTLAITKIILEVDTRYCVPDNCTALTPVSKKDPDKCNFANGCSWDSGDDRCEIYGCLNITDKESCTQGYHHCVWDAAKKHPCDNPPGPQPVCNHTLVGHLDLSQQDWGRHAHHGHPMSPIDYWHGNTLIKTNGFWFSTWAEGECKPDDQSQSFCSWRLVERVKKVGKLCSDAAIDAAIVKGDTEASWGAHCFNKCSPADQKNTTSECWIECFYNNILGPLGTSQLLNHSSPNFGIPMPVLQDAWDKPFLSETKGGCPSLP
eukprot:gene1393-9813_t